MDYWHRTMAAKFNKYRKMEGFLNNLLMIREKEQEVLNLSKKLHLQVALDSDGSSGISEGSLGSPEDLSIATPPPGSPDQGLHTPAVSSPRQHPSQLSALDDQYQNLGKNRFSENLTTHQQVDFNHNDHPEQQGCGQIQQEARAPQEHSYQSFSEGLNQQTYNETPLRSALGSFTDNFSHQGPTEKSVYQCHGDDLGHHLYAEDLSRRSFNEELSNHSFPDRPSLGNYRDPETDTDDPVGVLERRSEDLWPQQDTQEPSFPEGSVNVKEESQQEREEQENLRNHHHHQQQQQQQQPSNMNRDSLQQQQVALAARAVLGLASPALTPPIFPFPPVAPEPDPLGMSSSTMLVRALATTAPRRPRGEKKPIPETLKDNKYFERRKRNNLAAKKSRDARKQREDQIAIRASYLEKENAILRAQVATLRDEATSLRHLLLQKKPKLHP